MRDNTPIPWYVFWPVWLLFCFNLLVNLGNLFTGDFSIIGLLVTVALGAVLHPRGLNYWGRYLND